MSKTNIIKINEAFKLENISILTHLFLYENFDKRNFCTDMVRLFYLKKETLRSKNNKENGLQLFYFISYIKIKQ